MIQQVRQVYFDVFVPEVNNWISHPFKGRVFQVDSNEVVLFTVGVLARTLCRTVQTIAVWEKTGKLPESAFDIGRSRFKRMYSEAQIRLCQTTLRQLVWREFGVDDPRKTLNDLFPHDQFFKTVRNRWMEEFNATP